LARKLKKVGHAYSGLINFLIPWKARGPGQLPLLPCPSAAAGLISCSNYHIIGTKKCFSRFARTIFTLLTFIFRGGSSREIWIFYFLFYITYITFMLTKKVLTKKKKKLTKKNRSLLHFFMSVFSKDLISKSVGS